VDPVTGDVTLTPADLDGLTISLPEDFDTDFSLSVTATAQETDPETGAVTEATSAPVALDVAVGAVADAPTVGVTAAVGDEDTAIALNIDPQAAAEDINGEVVSVTIAGVPEGATLSAGTFNAETGEWTVAAADVVGLTVTPATNDSTDFTLTVTATAQETDPETGDISTATSDPVTLDVTVAGIADGAAVADTAAAGDEDTGIDLPISIDKADADETAQITLSGIPQGAVLSNANGEITVTDGVAVLSEADLAGLQITPPADSDADFNIGVSVVTSDGTTTSDPATGTITVGVDGVADVPSLTVGNVSGAEDTAIPLNITAGLTDLDGSESLSVTISGVPAGASLSAGTFDAETGDWVLTADDLAGLTITPALNDSTDFTLTVTATATEADGGDTAVVTGTMDVIVGAVADAPVLVVNDVTGNEDTAIPLDITASLQDGAETLSLSISGIPDGAVLTVTNASGEPVGVPVIGGVANIPPGLLGGDLAITPPADSADDFQLTVTAISNDNGSIATTTDTLDVTVQGVADGAQVTDTTATGAEDTAVPFTVDVSEIDTDGSETLSVTLSDIPEGAVITRNGEPVAVNVDGTVTLGEGELDGLAVLPPADFSGNIALTVSATTTDEGDVSETALGTVSIDVTGVADGAAVADAAATGAEDTAIDLPISIDKADASETAEITLSGIPEGAVLTNAGGPVTVTDGIAVLSEADLAGLQITPPADSGTDFQLGVSVVTTDGESTSEPAAGTITVGVDAVADVPSLSVGSAAGTEDTAIPLNITAGLNDTDGSEVLSVTISDVPPGAVLTLGDGSFFTATPENTTFLFAGDQLDGLTITPPENSDVDFTLNVIATSLDTDPDTGAVTTSSVEGSMAVSVDPNADAPTLTLDDAAGTEDHAIALNIDAGLSDDSEVLSVTISGVPGGATLSAGTYDADTGEWTVDPADLGGLTITPPADSNEDFALTVTATSTESDGSTASTTSTLNVAVTGVADAPTLTVDLGEGVPAGGGGTEEVPGSVTVTNVGNASAGYHNTYGYYVIGPDGAPQSGEIIWGDVKDSVGDTFTLDGVDPDDIGFFVIPNGDSLNPNISDGMDVTFAQGADGQWYVVGPDGQNLSGQGDPVLFSDPALNENQFDYTQDSGSPGNQNWEDLVGGGDNDFNDINMNVTTVPAQPGTPGGDAVVEYPLDINAALTDIDGSETLSATISGVPEGATLTLADGTVLTSTGAADAFDLTTEQLQGITLTVPADATDFDLSVTATATENDGDTASVSTTVAVDVPEPEGPDLSVVDAQGNEDTAITLNIAAAFEGGGSGGGDTTGSFYLLEEGSDSVLRINLDGSIETVVTQDEITALTGKHDADLEDMSVVTDADGNVFFTEKDSDSILMKPADGGDLQVVASKSDIMAATGDNSADPRGLVIGSDGNLYMTDEDSDSLLRVDPATGEVTVVATEQQLDDLGGIREVDLEGGMIATPDGKIHFVSAGEPDAVFTYDIATGESSVLAKGGEFNDLDSYLALAPNGDVIVIDESGDNSGAFDTIYRIDAETGEVSVFLSNDQLRDVVGHAVDLEGGISFDADGNFYIAEEQSDSIFKFSATDSATGAVDPASGEVFVSKADLYDHFGTGTNADLEGDLFFAQMIADGDDSLSITISDIPEGAVLAVNGEPVTVTDGTAELSAGQLAGLTITPPADSDEDFALTVTATGTTESGQQVSSTASLNVTVDAVADAPIVTAQDAQGLEDQPVALDITAALADMDGSETITGITISGVPAGATLNHGTYDAASDAWTLEPADLVDLELTPAANSDTDFQLTITATSQEADGGDTAVGSVTMDVGVEAVADVPIITSLTIGEPIVIEGTDGTGETVTISSANFGEDGAGFTVAARTINEDGSLSEASTDNVSTNGSPLGFGVAGGASGADSELGYDSEHGVSEELIVSFDEDVSSADVAFAWMNSGESAVFKLYRDGVEVGSGTVNGGSDGVDAPITLSATDGGAFDQIVFSAPGHGDDYLINSISFETPGSTPDVAEYPIDVSASLADADGSEDLSVTIGGVPEGAALSAGTDNGDGTWTVSGGELSGLTLSVPFDGEVEAFDLTFTATATEQSNSSTADSVPVTATAQAVVVEAQPEPEPEPEPEPVNADVLVSAAIGEGAISEADEAIVYDLDVTATVDGEPAGEDASITISGIPAGATLTAGTDNGDGTYTLTPAQLSGLQMLVSDAVTADFSLSVTAQQGGQVSAVDNVLAEVDPSLFFEVGEEDFNNDDAVGGDTSKDNWTGDWQSETFAGSTKNDDLESGGGGDTLYGGAGNDDLTGSWGEDTLYGGSGNDEIDGGTGNDQIFGGSGKDEIEAGDNDDLVFGGSGNDEIDGGTGNDTLYGGSGDDKIDGDHGDDTVYGGTGNDDIDAGTGNDFVHGGAGDDKIDGDHGNDTLYGGSGNDEIDGGTGNDALFGGLGDDVLTGGYGDDVLFGGAGNDVLNGGDGSDTFIFDADSGHDIIEDIMMQDTLEFQGEQFDMNDMIFSENEEGDAVISFAGNDDTSVTLEGVKYADLDTNGDGDASEGYTVTQTDDGFTVNIDDT
ncbi:MAG: hypothetical protein COW30_18045, partial [Rhodospirillales bacterium CG15_BIG_FIL_POST_REV_8_21_14_020_66_15]